MGSLPDSSAVREIIVWYRDYIAMAMSGGSTVKAMLLPALRKASTEIAKMLEDGRKYFETMKYDRLDEFVNSDCKVGLFAVRPMNLYADCMEEAEVKTRAELEELWKGCYHDEEVRESVEEFLSLEESLQELYDEVDMEIQKAEDRASFKNITKVGEQLPTDLSLTECKSGKLVHLENMWKQSKFTLFVPLKFTS